MSLRGPRMSLLLGAMLVGLAGIDAPPRHRDEPDPEPPRPPDPPRPREPRTVPAHIPPPTFRELSMQQPAPAPRELTRDEIAAQAKRERKAEKRRLNDERRRS